MSFSAGCHNVLLNLDFFRYIQYLIIYYNVGKLYSTVSWPDRNAELRDLFSKEKEYVHVLDKIVNVRHNYDYTSLTNGFLIICYNRTIWFRYAKRRF